VRLRLTAGCVFLVVASGCYGGDELPEVPPPPATTPSAPAEPVILDGDGSGVFPVTLRPNEPFVVTALAESRSRFQVVLLVSPGRQQIILFDQRGPVDDRAALWPSAITTTTGDVRVRASGHWTLELSQPRPPADPASLPAELDGRGYEVVPVRVESALRSLSVEYRRNEPIFVVLIPYEPFASGVQLFDGTGPVERRIEISEPPQEGEYLLHVRANGRWRVALGP
jgi:hypothetical protein